MKAMTNLMGLALAGAVLSGGTYTPQFLTQEEYDAIIAGEHETCE